MKSKNVKISKFLSLILRHKPDTIGLELDENGWADTHVLIDKVCEYGQAINFETLKEVVESNDKKRFRFNSDYTRIRANQGHSLSVDLNLKAVTPPEILFHGTAIKNIESIKKSGLLKLKRHHVHLSKDIETANKVGMRYGKPIVLTIDSKKMHMDGAVFFLSDNKVWLTDHVDVKYIKLEE